MSFSRYTFAATFLDARDALLQRKDTASSEERRWAELKQQLDDQQQRLRQEREQLKAKHCFVLASKIACPCLLAVG